MREREWRALTGLGAAGYAVPAAHAFEPDPRTLGNPFVVIEQIAGEQLWVIYERAAPGERSLNAMCCCGCRARTRCGPRAPTGCGSRWPSRVTAALPPQGAMAWPPAAAIEARAPPLRAEPEAPALHFALAAPPMIEPAPVAAPALVAAPPAPAAIAPPAPTLTAPALAAPETSETASAAQK